MNYELCVEESKAAASNDLKSLSDRLQQTDILEPMHRMHECRFNFQELSEAAIHSR